MKKIFKSKVFIAIISTFIITILLELAAIYIVHVSLPPRKMIRRYDHMVYESFEKIRDGADLIIVGEETKDFSSYKPLYTLDESKRNVREFFTTSKIKVLKVLKGEYKERYIPLVQHAALISRLYELRRYFYIEEDYSVMKKGMKYLLFIKYSDGRYWIAGANEGKMSIDGLDKSEITEPESEDPYFIKLKPEVLEKLKDQIQEFIK